MYVNLLINIALHVIQTPSTNAKMVGVKWLEKENQKLRSTRPCQMVGEELIDKFSPLFTSA
jgi:hypothetical protein